MREDGGCAVDLWAALVGAVWRGTGGETVTYSSRGAAWVVGWVREDGDDVSWHLTGAHPGVAPWIAAAMADSGWSWSPDDRSNLSAG